MEEFNRLEKILKGRVSFLEELIHRKERPFELILLVGASIESVARLLNNWICNGQLWGDPTFRRNYLARVLTDGKIRKIMVSDLLIKWTNYKEKWKFISIPDVFKTIAEDIIFHDFKSFIAIAKKLKKLGGWSKKKSGVESWDNPFVNPLQVKEIVGGTEYKWILNFKLYKIFFEGYRNGSVHELVPERIILNPDNFFEETEPYLVIDKYGMEWTVGMLSDLNMNVVSGVSFPAKFLVKTLEEIFTNLINLLKKMAEKGEINPGFCEFLDLSLGYWEDEEIKYD